MLSLSFFAQTDREQRSSQRTLIVPNCVSCRSHLDLSSSPKQSNTLSTGWGPVHGTSSGPIIAEEIGPIPELKQASPALERNPSHSGGLSKLIKKPPSNESFPFPSMTVTPASTSPAPRIPVSTPQIEVSGTHHRRLKILDVPSSKQKLLEEHNRFIRSHSEGDQTENSQYKPVKPRILLVDDDEVNLKLLQTFFVRRGFTDMRLAGDGSEAVKVYEDALHEHDPFHLVFMDISIPVCN
jgi:CheY-like chemotaxis protein